MASEWQTAFVVSCKIPWCALLTAVKNYNKSWITARLFLQDRDQDQDHSRPRLHDPRPRPRLSFFFVLEAPRDQDPGLEDYIAVSHSPIAPKCWGVHRVARCTIAYIITSVCCCTMSILSVNKKRELNGIHSLMRTRLWDQHVYEMFMRSNILPRRYSKCSLSVKLTVFKAHQSHFAHSGDSNYILTAIIFLLLLLYY